MNDELTISETKKLLSNLEDDIKELVTRFSKETKTWVSRIELDLQDVYERDIQLDNYPSRPITGRGKLVGRIVNVRVVAEI